jgi:hypothetical protein
VQVHFSGVPIEPYCNPSESLPAKMNCDRAEEPLVEHRRLIRHALPDAVADGDAAVLQFQHADADAVADAVDVQHHSGRRSSFPASVTSSAIAKSFFRGLFQSIR